MPPRLIEDSRDLIVYKDEEQFPPDLNLRKLERELRLYFKVNFESPKKATQALDSLSKHPCAHEKMGPDLLFKVFDDLIRVTQPYSEVSALEIVMYREFATRLPPISVIRKLFWIQAQLALLGGH